MRKRRLRKEKIMQNSFLFMLMFNLFLHFDYVEDHFNSANSGEVMFVEPEVFCSTSLYIEKPSHRDSFLVWSFAWGTALSSEVQPKSTALGLFFRGQGNLATSKRFLTETNLHIFKLLSRFSGLAPPLV